MTPVLTGFRSNIHMVKDGNGVLAVINPPSEWIMPDHIREGMADFFREHGGARWDNNTE